VLRVIEPFVLVKNLIQVESWITSGAKARFRGEVECAG